MKQNKRTNKTKTKTKTKPEQYKRHLGNLVCSFEYLFACSISNSAFITLIFVSSTFLSIEPVFCPCSSNSLFMEVEISFIYPATLFISCNYFALSF